jgi:hypothetical protein
MSNERFPGDRLFTSAISLSVSIKSQRTTKASDSGELAVEFLKTALATSFETALRASSG